MKYLVDTCVWRDYFQNRTSKGGRPLNEYAEKFFTKAILCLDTILIPDVVLEELNANYDVTGILMLLKLEKLTSTKTLLKEAKLLSQKLKVPFIDAVVALHSANNKVILVTRDTHFFNDLKEYCDAIRPEDIK